MIAPATRVVYVVRHGRTALNAEGRLRGHLDPPLDEVGLEEVCELGEAFAALPVRPARVVSGPLQRTRQTAEAIAGLCGIEICIEPRLVDRDYGPWTGAPSVDVQARFGSALADLPGARASRRCQQARS